MHQNPFGGQVPPDPLKELTGRERRGGNGK